MCESCFDYTYTAHGGIGCWEADDCCRAGSAFCHYNSGHVGAGAPYVHGPDAAIAPAEIPDPVPGVLPYEPVPTPAAEVPELPQPNGQPPTELDPPTPDRVPQEIPGLDLDPLDIPDTGEPPVGDLD